MFVLIVVLVLVIFGAVDVNSHCHNSDPCEDVHNDIISGHRWDTNHNNDVRYYVNEHKPIPILPGLHPNVTRAS